MVHDRPDDLREGQRQHRQIDAGEADREPAEQQRAGAGRDRRDQQGERHVGGEELDQQAGPIGAEAEIGGVAERVHASRSHDEMQAGREDHRDQHVDAEHEHVGVPGLDQRQEDQTDQQRRARKLEGGGGRADRIVLGGRIAHRDLRTAQQAIRPHDQDHRHHQEFGDQRELGEIDREAAEVDHADADAQRLDLGDDDGSEISAGDRSHAADHHDHEGVAQDGEVHRQVGGLARELQRAAKAGEERAAGEHRGEQQRLIDAERADHLAVLGGGADEASEAGLGLQQVEQEEDERTGEEQEQVVGRKAAVEDLDRAAQARRARAEQVLVAPDPERGVVDDQQHREGREQLEEFGRLVDAPQQQDFDRGADRRDRKRREQQAAPESETATDLGRNAVGDVDAQHVERTVRDVHDPRHAEDQRQAGADEEQAGGGGEPVERLKQEGVERHR